MTISDNAGGVNVPVPPTSPPRTALRTVGLVKQYGDVTAVNGLDLEVCVGECFGLLGPNGAGKTTTVEILEGLIKPDGGTVEILGYSWGGQNDGDLRNRLGVQLQETKLGEKLTVEETIKLFRSFYHDGRDVDELIRMVELGEKRRSRVGKLSGGQKQRLALACALAGDPDILFLDEPTTGLDPQARLKLWDIVVRFRAGGGTIILTTHYMEEAARLCDRVAIMNQGNIIALGTPAELVASLGAEQIVEFSASVELKHETLAALTGVRAVRRMGGVSSLVVSDIGAALAALLAEIKRESAELLTLTTHQATLEDVFVSMTGRMLREE
ncbi:MAG TPA: ABC transporter ATP-binding protein [Pyrinomonadaceae bacterium]|jgi:ABC-2 type transport system ATP-binding protein